jgi:selenocysteine-specific elongation factor
MTFFAASPSAPPSAKECQAEVGEEIFSILKESGELVCVSEEVVFRKADYEVMVEKIRQELHQKGKLTLAEVRDLLQTSRKYVQALLEHLDAVGVTVREGDFRKLKR